MSGLAIHLPFYATGLRADKLAEALDELTPKLIRLGALEVRVYRSKDDAYKFLQIVHLASKADWERIWNSDAFITFRTVCSPWYQKPLAYVMHETVSHAVGPGVHDVFGDAPYDAPVQGEAAASEPVTASSPGVGG